MAEAARQAAERERRGRAAARTPDDRARAEAAPEGPALPGAETRHAALLADPRLGELGAGQRARLMRQLQRGGGNGYAERVVARAQAAAAPATRPVAAATPEGREQEGPEAEELAAPAAGWAAAPPPADEGTVRRWSLGGAFKAVTGAVSGALSGGGLLRTIVGLARNLPGYSMLGLVLGRDPISGDAVERSPKNVLRALMGMVPVVGEQLFLAMDEAGAIDRAFGWADEQLKALGLSFDLVKATFKKAWDALSLKDAILDPGGTWNRLKAIFLEPIGKIRRFVGAALEKVKQFIFEAMMEKLGGGPVLGLLQRAGGALGAIVKDPIGFLGNLIKGVGQGLKQFGANILTHLKKGLFGWLFGEMGAAGIQLPRGFDLPGILDLVLQVLGLTWGFLRGQAAKVLGEPVVAKAETGFAAFSAVRERGVGGLWDYVKEQLGNLKELVFDAVKDLVASQVVQAGIQWLVGILGGPAGALVKAIKAIYDVVMWFVSNASRIGALVNSIGDSIGAIAAGALGQAAGFIERSLASAVPMLISFLASLLGLGGLGQKIRGVIERLQAPVKKAVGFVLGKLKAWAKRLWGKVKGAVGGKDKRTTAEKETAERAAAIAAHKLLTASGATVEGVESGLPGIKKAYRLSSIQLVSEGGGKYHIRTLISRTNSESAQLGKTKIKMLILGELSFEYSKKLRERLPKNVDITATSADPREKVEAAGARGGFKLPEQHEGFTIKFDVLGEELGNHFANDKFDVIIINSPHIPAPPGQSVTKANQDLLKAILREAKRFLAPGGRIDLQIGPRHPGNSIRGLKQTRQESLLSAQYEYGVEYTARQSSDSGKYGQAFPPSNAYWKAYIFEGETLERLDDILK